MSRIDDLLTLSGNIARDLSPGPGDSYPFRTQYDHDRVTARAFRNLGVMHAILEELQRETETRAAPLDRAGQYPLPPEAFTTGPGSADVAHERPACGETEAPLFWRIGDSFYNLRHMSTFESLEFSDPNGVVFAGLIRFQGLRTPVALTPPEWGAILAHLKANGEVIDLDAQSGQVASTTSEA